tara:strand:- start:33920 stop:35152 length:1233 start_codon:yes stop_codon:yes gene_type:complete
MLKLKNIFSIKELIIIFFIFTAIIYSTSLHYANSPPNDTFEPGQFLTETPSYDGGDPVLDKYFKNRGVFYKKFFSDGKWSEEFHPRDLTGWNDMWKNTAMSADNAYYILYAAYYAGLIEKIDYSVEGANLSMAVHKYRILMPFMVGKLCSISKIFDAKNYSWSEKYYSVIVYLYIILNFIFILTTAFLFMFFLINIFSFSKYLSIIGSILFLTLPIVTKSTGFPQSEPIALLITLLLFTTTFYNRKFLYLIFSFLGLLTKDLFVFTSVLWIFNFNFFKEKKIIKYLKHILIGIIPIIFFILIRLIVSDDGIIETRGSYDILKGDLPPWTVTSNFYYHFEKLFLVFTFLWLGLVNLKESEFLKKSTATLVFLTLISLWIARGSGIERHVGLMYPLVIPCFLFFFHKNLKIK